jgi:hypothetical protein
MQEFRSDLFQGDAVMPRWFTAPLAGALTLFAAEALRAEGGKSLGNADLVGTITATQKAEKDIERSPVVGYVTVGECVVAVGVGTRITEGPGDLVGRGFGSLRKGCRVEVVLERSGKDKIAAQINIVPGPPGDK